MKFDGEVKIHAPIEKVWAGMTDPNLVSQCAPGLQSMQILVPDKEFKVVAAIGFGTVKVTFDANVEWIEMDPCNFAKVKAHGKAPGSGVDVVSEMRLTSIDPENTDLNWSADIVIVGTIASLASRMMGGMTKKMTSTFFDCIRSKIEV
jgi:carbon monoxide dehydrogenase subunit G